MLCLIKLQLKPRLNNKRKREKKNHQEKKTKAIIESAASRMHIKL